MTLMRPDRIAAALLIAAVALSACGRKDEEKAPAGPDGTGPAPAAQTAAAAGAPFSFAQKTPAAEVSLKLPDALSAEPDLHASLYSDGVKDLRAFLDGAQASRAEEEGALEGDATGSAPPYARALEWAKAGETGKLLSLKQTVYEYTGGAHPNTAYGAVIWDKAMKRPVTPASLFRRGADYAALDRALCAAIEAAKSERLGQTVSMAEGGWTCPTWRDSLFVLAASDQPGKAGGVTFLYGPYQIGPYAEGGYEVTVPQSVFRAALAPAYADEFAGRPVKR